MPLYRGLCGKALALFQQVHLHGPCIEQLLLQPARLGAQLVQRGLQRRITNAQINTITFFNMLRNINNILQLTTNA